jgi:hypothetical protein
VFHNMNRNDRLLLRTKNLKLRLTKKSKRIHRERWNGVPSRTIKLWMTSKANPALTKLKILIMDPVSERV